MVEYGYDAWGNLLFTSGSMAGTLGADNPFRYRGYYYDDETELYCLNSRYYSPEWGRYLNTDGYVSTGQGLFGSNMFVYCGNDPVNRADPSGMFWEKVGKFFKKAGSALVSAFKAVFGAGSSTSITEKKEEKIWKEPSPITITEGKKVTETITESGDTSKPISIYSKHDIVNDNPIKSTSAGLKVNISKVTIDLSLGLDNTGISVSFTNDNVTDTVGLTLNLSELKLGVECSSAIKWDDTTTTTYTNVSISGWFLVAVFMLANGSDFAYSPGYAY